MICWSRCSRSSRVMLGSLRWRWSRPYGAAGRPSRGPIKGGLGGAGEQQDRRPAKAHRVHAVLQTEAVEAQQRPRFAQRHTHRAYPRQPTELLIGRLRPQRLGAVDRHAQAPIQLLAVPLMHAPPAQFLQRQRTACALLTRQQVALHLRGAYRAPRQRARRQHRMRAPAPPALHPQNLDRPPVQVLLVAAVMTKPPAAAGRTAHAVQPRGNVFDPVALFLAVDYDDRSGLRGNRVGGQPTLPGFPSSLCSGSPTAKREFQPLSTTRPRALTRARLTGAARACLQRIGVTP